LLNSLGTWVVASLQRIWVKSEPCIEPSQYMALG